jgi:hypothetical protein
MLQFPTVFNSNSAATNSAELNMAYIQNGCLLPFAGVLGVFIDTRIPVVRLSDGLPRSRSWIFWGRKTSVKYASSICWSASSSRPLLRCVSRLCAAMNDVAPTGTMTKISINTSQSDQSYCLLSLRNLGVNCYEHPPFGLVDTNMAEELRWVSRIQ